MMFAHGSVSKSALQLRIPPFVTRSKACGRPFSSASARNSSTNWAISGLAFSKPRLSDRLPVLRTYDSRSSRAIHAFASSTRSPTFVNAWA
jgi:hypothetical protein